MSLAVSGASHYGRVPGAFARMPKQRTCPMEAAVKGFDTDKVRADAGTAVQKCLFLEPNLVVYNREKWPRRSIFVCVQSQSGVVKKAAAAVLFVLI